LNLLILFNKNISNLSREYGFQLTLILKGKMALQVCYYPFGLAKKCLTIKKENKNDSEDKEEPDKKPQKLKKEIRKTSVWLSNDQGDLANIEGFDEKQQGLKKDKQDNKKINVLVLDDQGDTIRNYTVKADTGLNRFQWGLERNGVRLPSYKNTKQDADLPGGPKVLPGNYKLIVQFKGLKDSVNVTVIPDSREGVSFEELSKKEKWIVQHARLVTTAKDAFDKLKEAVKTIDLINKQLDHVDVHDTIVKTLKKKGKAMNDSIKLLMRSFLLPEDFKGYDHVSVNLERQLSKVGEYIHSSRGEPGATAKSMLVQVEKELNLILDSMNSFFTESWTVYQKEVEQSQLSLFKDYKPIYLEKE